MAKKTIKTSVEEKLDKSKDIGKSIRPNTLSDYIGQEKLKQSIAVLVKSAKVRNEVPGHILLYGQPGLGKTTMAYILANEMNMPIVTTVGNNIEKPSDVATLLNGIIDNSVVFIDEIHRMNSVAEECLYSAMEDGFISILIGEGAQAKNIKLTLPKFTLIGATTKAGMISAPLRDRFIYQYKMEPYTINELKQIAKNTCDKLDIYPDDTQLEMIASVSRGVPRAVNKYCILIRDYAFAHSDGIVNNNTVSDAMELAGVYKNGLTDIDIEILNILYNSKKAVGIKTLTNILGEDENTIKEVYEPFLLSKGYIIIESKGRNITELGKEYLEENYVK